MQELIPQPICNCMYLGAETVGEQVLRRVKLEVHDGEPNREANAMRGSWAFFPIHFDPAKHKVVMIDSMTEQVICRITGEKYKLKKGDPWPGDSGLIYDDPPEEKSAERKYHNEYCLYLQYMISIECEPAEYDVWAEDWETNNLVRREAILKRYAQLAGYSYKPISLQENSDAFCFNLYVNPKDV